MKSGKRAILNPKNEKKINHAFTPLDRRRRSKLWNIYSNCLKSKKELNFCLKLHILFLIFLHPYGVDLFLITFIPNSVFPLKFVYFFIAAVETLKNFKKRKTVKSSIKQNVCPTIRHSWRWHEDRLFLSLKCDVAFIAVFDIFSFI